MSNKWRVSYEDHVLGHFAAKTPIEAVEKAVTKHDGLLPIIGPCTVIRAGNADAKEYTVIVYEG